MLMNLLLNLEKFYIQNIKKSLTYEGINKWEVFLYA